MLNLKLKGLTMNKLRKVHKEMQLWFHEMNRIYRTNHPDLPPCHFLSQGVLATCGSVLLAHLGKVGSLLGRDSCGWKAWWSWELWGKQALPRADGELAKVKSMLNPEG